MIAGDEIRNCSQQINMCPISGCSELVSSTHTVFNDNKSVRTFIINTILW